MRPSRVAYPPGAPSGPPLAPPLASKGGPTGYRGTPHPHMGVRKKRTAMSGTHHPLPLRCAGRSLYWPESKWVPPRRTPTRPGLVRGGRTGRLAAPCSGALRVRIGRWLLSVGPGLASRTTTRPQDRSLPRYPSVRVLAGWGGGLQHFQIGRSPGWSVLVLTGRQRPKFAIYFQIGRSPGLSVLVLAGRQRPSASKRHRVP